MRALPLVLLALTGCSPLFGGGDGVSNATPTFSFASCGNACSPDDWNLAAGGAHTTIQITGADFADVRSSDPAIATFVANDVRDVEAFTGNPGQVTLTLIDHGGGVVASKSMIVVATASLSVNGGWSSTHGPTMLEGTAQLFHVSTHDAQGLSTRGDGAVAFTLSGALADAVLPFIGDEIAITGTPGSGVITASCIDATLTQPITIVAESAVTGLEAATIPSPDGTVLVAVSAQTAGGAIYAGPCAWEVSDPSVTLAQQLPPTFDLGPASASIFTLTRPGSYGATCTLAGRTTSVMLSR